MADSIRDKIATYQPSKTVWFWTTVGAVVVTIVIGFTWGGWVTGGAALERAESASKQAVLAFAADICAYRFLQGSDAGARLTALKEEKSSFQRGAMIEDGGWVTFAGAESPMSGVGRECAERLMEAKAPAVAPVAAAATEATPS